MSQIAPMKPVRQREGKPYENRKHMEFVATFACWICGTRPVQVHHTLHPVKTKRGASRKAGDDETSPLCLECHEMAHRGPESFHRKWGAQEREVIDDLWARSPFNIEDR